MADDKTRRPERKPAVPSAAAKRDHIDELFERILSQPIVKRDTVGTGRDLPNLSRRTLPRTD